MHAKSKTIYHFNSARPSVHPETHFPWDDQFVNEADSEAFLFFPPYWLVYDQMISNFVSQTGQMESHGIPNDMLHAVNSTSIIVLIPTCEFLAYPFIRRFTPFRPVTRIFWWFILAAAGMMYAVF